MSFLKVLGGSICAAFITAFFSTSAAADYKEQLSGRTINVMVGFSNSGAGARFWSLFADHLRRHLPDTVIRAEFSDGALTVGAISDLYEMEQGTLAIGLIRPPEIAFTQINDPNSLQVDLQDAHWLMSVENLSYIMAARRDMPLDIDGLRSPAAPHILPVNDPLATATVVSVLLGAVTDIPIRTVVGFGRSARSAALLAGDIDLLTVGVDPAVEALATSGDILPVYKIVGDDFGSLGATTPDLKDFLRDDAPETVVDFIRSARGIGRAFFAPPSTDPADVAAFIDLLEAIVADPVFIADAQLKGIVVAAQSADTLSAQIAALVPDLEADKQLIVNSYRCGLDMALNADHSCDF